MKITKNQLRRMILEEAKIVKEATATGPMARHPAQNGGADSRLNTEQDGAAELAPQAAVEAGTEGETSLEGKDALLSDAGNWFNNRDVREAVDGLYAALLAMHGEDPNQYRQSLEPKEEEQDQGPQQPPPAASEKGPDQGAV